MNIYLLIAGGIGLAGTSVHIVAGERSVVAAFMGANALHPRVKCILHACWHAVTLMLMLVSVGFLWAGLDSDFSLLAGAATATTLTMAGCTLFMVVRHRQRLRDFWPWTLFWLMSGLGIAGLFTA
jgi:hypothetical protein